MCIWFGLLLVWCNPNLLMKSMLGLRGFWSVYLCSCLFVSLFLSFFLFTILFFFLLSFLTTVFRYLRSHIYLCVWVWGEVVIHTFDWLLSMISRCSYCLSVASKPVLFFFLEARGWSSVCSISSTTTIIITFSLSELSGRSKQQALTSTRSRNRNIDPVGCANQLTL